MSVYIVFASWEDRFIQGVENDINSGSGDISSIYCFYFEEFYSRTKKEIDKLKSLSKDKKIPYKKIALKFDEYIDSWMRVKTEFNTMHFNDVAQLNISTMPRNMIFCMLHSLKGKEYEVFYYPAEKIGKDPTKNPSTPHIVLQHGGIMHLDKKTMLVVFVGHDRKRVYQLYNHFEPDRIKLIKIKHHYSPTPEDYGSFSDISNIEEIEIESPSSQDAFDKLNEELTTEILEKYNVLVCSLGPKIQSLGIYKFHQLHKKIALLYSPSKDYADDYSTGIKLGDLEKQTSAWIGV